MKLVSLTVAKNEAWVIGASLRAALKWCDAAVVLLHDCSDGTRAIVTQVSVENPDRVNVLFSTGPSWCEMVDRQRTLEEARRMGATHCAIVDSDEILCGDMLDSIRGHIEASMPGWFAGIPMRNLYGSIDQYRSEDGIWGQRAGTMLAFTDRPDLSWKVPAGQDFHHRSPVNSRWMGMIPGGGIMHLQFASRRRLLAKHAWYKMMERIRFPHKDRLSIEAMYNQAPSTTGVVLSPVPESWWAPHADLLRYIDLDAEPWQEAACRRMWDQHGGAMFAGLDLFGVLDMVAA